jgi:hypothetical protein
MANLSAFGGAQPITPGGLVELGYGQITSTVVVSSTSFTTPTTIIPDVTVVCDGSPIMVEFYAPQTSISAGQSQLVFALWEDGAEKHRYWQLKVNPAGSTGVDYDGVKAETRLTPSAGTHTYRVVGISGPANNSVLAGSATTSNSPAFLRISKIVQQNDGLKPFWTPPIVTQLPSNATVGDQVVYAADAANGVYWSLYYDGIGTYPWKFVGGSSLKSWSNTTFSTSSTSFVVDTNFTGITIPLAGDYEITAHALGNNATAFNWWLWRPNGCGYDTGDFRGIRASSGNNGNYESGSHYDRYTLTTGTLGAAARVVGSTMTVATRSIHVSPVRVAA